MNSKNIIITEKYNVAELKLCIENNVIDSDKLQKILKKLKITKNIGLLDVKLTFKNGERAYPKDGLTMSILCKPTRERVSVKCMDADMKNSQPSILSYLCSKHNVRCDAVDYYIKNRITLDLPKKEINKIINGGKTDNKHIFFKKLTDEIEMINKQFENNPAFILNIKHAKTKKDIINPKNFLYYITSEIETKIMLECMEHIGKTFPSVHINSYEYDGNKLQLPKSVNPSEIINELNKITEHLKIEWINKPFNQHITQIDETSKTDENDDRANDQINADNLKEVFKDRLFITKVGLMVYDDKLGVWSANPEDHYRIFLDNYREFPIRNPISFETTFKPVIKILNVISPKNDNFFNDSDIGYLLFNNGVLDMKKFKMLQFSPDYRFTKRNNRDFDTKKEYDTETLMERIFETMLTDQVKRDYFLQLLARGIAGEYKDRQFFQLVGKTACGKTLITKLFKLTFQNLIGFFNAENFLKKLGNGDTERDWTFMMDIYDCRICFSSEMEDKSENGKEILMNAQKLKKGTSAGDPIKGRKLFGHEIEVIMKCLFGFLGNDAKNVSPCDDAYISRANIIEADRSSLKTIDEPNLKFFPADETIQDYILLDSTQNALIALMCDYYILDRYVKPDCVIDATKSYSGDCFNPDNWIKENYEIIPIKTDWKNNDNEWNWEKIGDNYLPFDALFQHYKSVETSISKTKFGLILNEFTNIAVKKIGGKGVRVRIGIKRFDESDDS
jgi:hypothetical protein